MSDCGFNPKRKEVRCCGAAGVWGTFQVGDQQISRGAVRGAVRTGIEKEELIGAAQDGLSGKPAKTKGEFSR